jgi:hypothetical protein
MVVLMTPPEPDWGAVLSGHRSPKKIPQLAAIFEAHGIAPDAVASALAAPEAFVAAAASRPDWVDAYGGPVAAALIAAEILEQAAALQITVSNIRSHLVAQLVDESSVVETARQLGYSHQHTSRLRKSGALVPALTALVRKGL